MNKAAKKRELIIAIRRWYGNLGPMNDWTMEQIENLLASAREHESYFNDDYERKIRE